MAGTQVNQVDLDEASADLPKLVDRAAHGEEIIIAKAGKPLARLSSFVPEPSQPEEPFVPRVFGRNVLGITYMADDWEDDIPLEYFQDEGKENPFGEPPVVAPNE